MVFLISYMSYNYIRKKINDEMSIIGKQIIEEKYCFHMRVCGSATGWAGVIWST